MSVLTKRTVTRRAVYVKALSGTLRHKGRGTAAVAVCCVNASCSDHNFGAFIHIHTKRIGGLTAVIHHDYDGTIRFDTDNRTCCRVGVMCRFGLVYTVFYDITGRAGNNLIFPSVKTGFVSYGSHFNFRNICRSCLSVFIGIFMNNDTGRETDRMVEVDLAVNHHETKRFVYTAGVFCVCGGVIPAEAGIHCTDNVFAPFLFNEGCVFRNG